MFSVGTLSGECCRLRCVGEDSLVGVRNCPLHGGILTPVCWAHPSITGPAAGRRGDPLAGKLIPESWELSEFLVGYRRKGRQTMAAGDLYVSGAGRGVENEPEAIEYSTAVHRCGLRRRMWGSSAIDPPVNDNPTTCSGFYDPTSGFFAAG